MTAAPLPLAKDAAPRRDWLPWIVGGLTILVLVAFLIYPILKTVLGAFVRQGNAQTLANWTFYNFERFFVAATYQSAVRNTILVSVLTTVAATLLALPAAYAVARIRMPLRNLLLAMSVIPLVAPPFIGAYSWIQLLGRSGIVTQYVSEWFGL